MYTEIEKCRICGNRNLVSVLHLGRQYLTGVFPKTADHLGSLTSGPLELVKCYDDQGHDVCGLLQLRQSYEPSEMYGANYGYRSSLNQSMVEHLHRKVRSITSRVALGKQDYVIDIGSNDATLLKAYPDNGANLVGMDPTGEKFRQYYPAHIRLIPDFFSARNFKNLVGNHKAKVVTSISMFYDLEDPLDFMRQVHEVLADDGVWVFEQSYMPLMLDSDSYDTVCHEHLEYYALSQIRWMAERVGLKIIDVELNNVNGGSFSITASKTGAAYQPNQTTIDKMLAGERSAGLHTLDPYRAFASRVSRHRDELIELLGKIKSQGQTIFGYGASTKGNVLLQFCGLTSADLPYIAEVNPDKFGAYTPGTAIPIISEQDAKAMKPDHFLVLPWHFRDNIVQREESFLKSGGKLVFPLPRIDVVGRMA